jgi:membrane protein
MARSGPSTPLGFFAYIPRHFQEQRCIQVAGSLAFTTLLALVPVFTIAVAVFSLFPKFFDPMAAIRAFIVANLVPEVAGKLVTGYLIQFSEKAARLTALGLGLFALTALVLMLTIDHELNAIWRVRKPRTWLRRLLTYGTVLTLGPLLVGASLSLTSYLLGLSLGWTQPDQGTRFFLLEFVPFLLMALAFTLVYRLVPNCPVSWWHALAGGLVAALLFEGVKEGFAAYLRLFPTYKLVYGAFASVPIFLVWIYLSWIVMLFGAVVASAFSRR